jgi:hypothetical protein
MNSQETEVLNTLRDMGFDEEKSKQAYALSQIKTVEGVINQIESMDSTPAPTTQEYSSNYTDKFKILTTLLKKKLLQNYSPRATQTL